MADIQPFRAYRYDTNRVALKDVLTQPYDKISPAMQDQYYAASPYNLIPVEKGRIFPDDTPENNVYTRAAKKVDEWIAEKILLAGRRAHHLHLLAGILCSRKRFPPHTRRLHRAHAAGGLRRADRLPPRTHPFRTEGRSHRTAAQHTRADRPAFSPLRRRRQKDRLAARRDVAQERPHRTEATNSASPIACGPFPMKLSFVRITQEMADKKLIIADGHHRYETALDYRNECRERLGTTDPMAAHEFAMATFINTHSKGLMILPTHRRHTQSAEFRFREIPQGGGRLFRLVFLPIPEFGGARRRLRRIPKRSRGPPPRPPRIWESTRAAVPFSCSCCGATPTWNICCPIFPKRSAGSTWSCCIA